MASRWMTSATSRRAVPELESFSASRGFTILELLVALGILLAAGGIMIPFTLAELERREVVLAEDQLGMLVRFARIEARRTGTPVEVMIDADGRQVEVRRLDPKSPGSVFAGESGREDSDSEFEDVRDLEESNPDRRVSSRWARRSLPDVALLRPPPEAESGREGLRPGDSFDELDPAFSSVSSSSAFEQPWPGPTRFAVAFPDGSVVTVTAVVLASRGRMRSWKIDPWSGQSTFVPFELPSPESLSEVEDDGVEEDPINDAGLDAGRESAEMAS
jgi:type II secretory pathway pseudopilin PulG